jgi:hypothetical protein
MPQAVQKHQDGKAQIVPILLSPCDYEGTLFSNLEVLPTGGKAVTLWSRRQEAYVDIARNIRARVEKLLALKWKVVGDDHYEQQYHELALSAY